MYAYAKILRSYVLMLVYLGSIFSSSVFSQDLVSTLEDSNLNLSEDSTSSVSLPYYYYCWRYPDLPECYYYGNDSSRYRSYHGSLYSDWGRGQWWGKRRWPYWTKSWKHSRGHLGYGGHWRRRDGEHHHRHHFGRRGGSHFQDRSHFRRGSDRGSYKQFHRRGRR